MTIPYEFPAGQIQFERGIYSIVDLPALFAPRISELPEARRLLLENIVRPSAEEERDDLIVFASRHGDWATKAQRQLGIHAVLAVSFERIHRSGLIRMGILPLQRPAGTNPQTLDLEPGDKIEVDADVQAIGVRCLVKTRMIRKNKKTQHLTARAAIETRTKTGLLRAGGVPPGRLSKIIVSIPAAKITIASAKTIAA